MVLESTSSSSSSSSTSSPPLTSSSSAPPPPPTPAMATPITEQLKAVMSKASQDEIDSVVEAAALDVIDEVIRGVGFDMHRCVKSGLFSVLYGDASAGSSPNKSGSSPHATKDIFGQDITTAVGVPTLKKQPGCVCPNCKRNLAASRFAPHLEKCMGMGRNSSRLASRRLATNSKDSYRESGGADGDDDDAEDEDWIEPGARGGGMMDAGSGGGGRRNRGNRDKNSPRRTKGRRGGGDRGGNGGTVTPPTSYDQLSTEERSQWLSSICGVVSNTSRKICSRSTRCPVHSDAQRREVRIRWLSAHPNQDHEDAHVDIDSFSEGDTAALRESLAQLSNASSPAESVISTGSHTSARGSSSRRQQEASAGAGGKRSRAKKGRPGSKNGSRGSTPPLAYME